MALVCMANLFALADAGTANARPAAALHARFLVLKGDPGHNQFRRPLYMDSREDANGAAGEILALLDHSFATTSAALGQPAQWCDVLILHLNTKYCRPGKSERGKVLHVSIGKKHDQLMEEAYRVDFGYRVTAASADFLQVTLLAEAGPLGTRDYRIVLEATPADAGRTLVRLAYSYSFGMVARFAMETYLGTIGRDKVGFTMIGRLSDGSPGYVGGMRGLVERNTMRYYLAIEAFLGSLSSPAATRMEKSLRDWFAASERYSRQLHEIEEGEYLAMKRREYLRQQLEVVAGAGAG